MGVLRAEKIVDYLSDPLRKCLKDDNPYVRKTAALCVAKLYDIKPSLAIDNGFIGMLRDMVGDSNPMVNRASHIQPILESAQVRCHIGRCECYNGSCGNRGYSHRGGRGERQCLCTRLSTAAQAARRLGRVH